MTRVISFGDRKIGPDHPCYIIAEIGVNHNGDLALARKLIDLAVETGADAVKFQTYVTDELVLPDAQKSDYQDRATSHKSQAEMLRDYELPFDDFHILKQHCDSAGIDFISTAFDAVSLDFVIGLDPVCLKWASGELTNTPLLRAAARSRLPVILSTGMGSLSEISKAVDQFGPDYPMVILQCVSQYPAEISDQNLRAIPMMQNAFGCPTGFSDHTLGPFAAIAARTLGASVIEKHFTLDKTLAGPDHSASATPEEFTFLVKTIRDIEAGLGDGVKRLQNAERNTAAVARKSLVYRRSLPKGSVIAETDLTAKRPGSGVPPDQFDTFVGRTLKRDVSSNQMLTPGDVD